MTAQTATEVETRTATDVAHELDGLSAGLPLAGRLKELASVLRSFDSGTPDSVGAQLWASVDIVGVFLGEGNQLLEETPPEGPRRSLERIIQVGVFVPILLTWIGLAHAAFTVKVGESLLQAWETGGWRWFTFRWVAVYIASTVFLLILAAVAQVFNRRRAGWSETDLRRRLAGSLVEADLFLAPYRLPADERAAPQIDAATARMTAAFDAAAAKVGAAADRLDASLDGAAAKVGAAAGQLGDVFDGAEAKVDAAFATAGEGSKRPRTLPPDASTYPSMPLRRRSMLWQRGWTRRSTPLRPR